MTINDWLGGIELELDRRDGQRETSLFPAKPRGVCAYNVDTTMCEAGRMEKVRHIELVTLMFPAPEPDSTFSLRGKSLVLGNPRRATG